MLVFDAAAIGFETVHYFKTDGNLWVYQSHVSFWCSCHRFWNSSLFLPSNIPRQL